jgi:hypothetical protein
LNLVHSGFLTIGDHPDVSQIMLATPGVSPAATRFTPKPCHYSFYAVSVMNRCDERCNYNFPRPPSAEEANVAVKGDTSGLNMNAT